LEKSSLVNKLLLIQNIAQKGFWLFLSVCLSNCWRICIRDPKFTGLLFHPDFILGAPFGKSIAQYSFFSYVANEALHLSPS